MIKKDKEDPGEMFDAYPRIREKHIQYIYATGFRGNLKEGSKDTEIQLYDDKLGEWVKLWLEPEVYEIRMT